MNGRGFSASSHLLDKIAIRLAPRNFLDEQIQQTAVGNATRAQRALIGKRLRRVDFARARNIAGFVAVGWRHNQHKLLLDLPLVILHGEASLDLADRGQRPAGARNRVHFTHHGAHTHRPVRVAAAAARAHCCRRRGSQAATLGLGGRATAKRLGELGLREDALPPQVFECRLPIHGTAGTGASAAAVAVVVGIGALLTRAGGGAAGHFRRRVLASLCRHGRESESRRDFSTERQQCGADLIGAHQMPLRARFLRIATPSVRARGGDGWRRADSGGFSFGDFKFGTPRPSAVSDTNLRIWSTACQLYIFSKNPRGNVTHTIAVARVARCARLRILIPFFPELKYVRSI